MGNNGTELAANYPLQDFQYPCQFKSKSSVGFVKSFSSVIGDEENLKQALSAIGPLAVGINGNIDSFFNYGKGVYDDPLCNDTINHAVLLVGYGTDHTFKPPKDYWIVKNSWSKNWGESGYMRLERGTGRCGIGKYVFYPEV